MTLEELKGLIKSGGIESNTKSIENGFLRNTSRQNIEYSVRHGWDIVSAAECDELWGRSNLELFELIDQQQYDNDKLTEVLASIQTEDHHWSWLSKSMCALSDEYEWFFLYADDKPQGACLIYHPKESALGASKIFYVEFLAVAPWNRSCLIRDRLYQGVGSVLLKSALRFSRDKLGLTLGFSLHSLPQASGYYQKLNMVNVNAMDKDQLLYFELPEHEAKKLVGAA